MSIVFTLWVIAITGSVAWLLIGRPTRSIQAVNITLAVIIVVLMILWLVFEFTGVSL